jgi:sigma-B regulation protein RsbU (phosphoserine phosphatase)
MTFLPDELPQGPQGDPDLYEGAACGLLVTTADGTITRANATFCRWVGREASELVGQTKLQQLLTMGGRIFQQTHWAPLLQMQNSVAEVKLDVLHKNGHAIPMLMNALRRERAGVWVHEHAMFVAEDRVKYERELVSARKKLELALAEAGDRSLLGEQMLGIVSHDLRNPLSTIQMAITLLERAPHTSAQAGIFQRISRASQRSLRLIADLLDFTQARLGKGLSVQIKPVDLRQVAAQAVEELALAFTGRTLLHTHSGAGACMGDADRLEQLIGNLVANAMAYGDPEREVTVASAITGHDYAISVHNFGPVIPQEKTASLFEPMTRGASEGASTSVGLGLYIVQQITRAHGGSVSVSSDEAAGTSFVARMPRG